MSFNSIFYEHVDDPHGQGCCHHWQVCVFLLEAVCVQAVSGRLFMSLVLTRFILFNSISTHECYPVTPNSTNFLLPPLFLSTGHFLWFFYSFALYNSELCSSEKVTLISVIISWVPNNYFLEKVRHPCFRILSFWLVGQWSGGTVPWSVMQALQPDHLVLNFSCSFLGIGHLRLLA